MGFRFLFKHFLVELGRYFLLNFLKITVNYGESVKRPIILSIMTIILFALLYYTTGCLCIPGAKLTFRDCLYHSATTFTTFGFSGVQPNLTSPLKALIAQALITIEAILGVLFTTLLIFAITYQVSR
ncbi:MAG: hypothetical protein DRO09_00660 [Thermoprotei archaeon]|nr:MAG: hypothetical protein DRO09_00660 [Thermoprotei archaeon]